MTKAERLAYQAGLETDRKANERPNIPPAPRPAEGTAAACGSGSSRTGRHDFSMRGPDGVYRCWYCVKTRAQVAEEHK